MRNLIAMRKYMSGDRAAAKQPREKITVFTMQDFTRPK